MTETSGINETGETVGDVEEQDEARGPGRTPKGKRVATYIPEDDLKIIDRLAADAGVSRSEWIAQAAQRRMRDHDVIELTLPTRERPELVDLAVLTPMARAVAEAIAQTTDRYICIRSRATERELMDPRFHDFYAPADEPITKVWDRWWKAPKATSAVDILEWEARKLIGWYPVARDGSELASSQAAAADDLLTGDQCISLLLQLCPGRSDITDKDLWMRHARKGDEGYPAAARRMSRGWLWSEADVRAFVARRLQQEPRPILSNSVQD